MTTSAAATVSSRAAREPADKPYLPLLAGVSFRPVFILGEHRSGTTLLYRLLGLSGCFNWLNVYHLLHYDSLLANHAQHREAEAKEALNRLFETRGIATRLLDDTPVTADYPEEYGMILHARTWRFGLGPKTLPVFDELCRKLQYIGETDNPVLLKNPADYSAFLYLRSVYPQARFIFIHRHPVEVLSSQLKALRSSWWEPNPFIEIVSETYARVQRVALVRRLARRVLSPDDPLHLARRVIVRRIIASSRFYRQNIGRLHRESYTTVRYEEMCGDARSVIGGILRFLGVRPRVTVDWNGLVNRRPPRLEPDVLAARAELCRQFGCSLAENEYTV